MAKFKKKDRTLPNAYCPIPSILTIIKGLKGVIANKMFYLTETHSLLSENHFGARKRHSCEQAMNVLMEKIYNTWRRSKVLTIITFDVKRAYNGVKADVLAVKLPWRKISEKFVKWMFFS